MFLHSNRFLLLWRLSSNYSSLIASMDPPFNLSSLVILWVMVESASENTWGSLRSIEIFSGHVQAANYYLGLYLRYFVCFCYHLMRFYRGSIFMFFPQKFQVELWQHDSFAIWSCLNFGLIDLISINRDIKSSLYRRSIKRASTLPAFDFYSRGKVLSV